MNPLTLAIPGPHKGLPVLPRGEPFGTATRALIMVHGRGASAEDMLSLADNLAAPGFIYLAPQANGHLWYPNRYDTPLAQNEPSLSSALAAVGFLVDQAVQAGIPAERVVLTGFSQGACVSAEFTARNARRYGGLAVLAGGMIGPKETPRDYPGSLERTPVYLGCSDPDEYFPPGWIDYSAEVFRKLGGKVTQQFFPNLGHRVNLEEIHALRDIMQAV